MTPQVLRDSRWYVSKSSIRIPCAPHKSWPDQPQQQPGARPGGSVHSVACGPVHALAEIARSNSAARLDQQCLLSVAAHVADDQPRPEIGTVVAVEHLRAVGREDRVPWTNEL